MDLEIDLLVVLVQEELVVEAFRRNPAQGLADRARGLDRVDQVLAAHLVVDAQRRPAHGPVGLPLHLHMAAGDGDLDLRTVLVLEDDRALLDIALQGRDLQHLAGGRADGQERRIGRAALFAERRQHHLLDRVEALERRQQGRVEQAALVAIGRADELVLEAKTVQERAQAGVVVGAEAVMGAEGVADDGQRLAQILDQRLLVLDVVGNLAQAVHVVAEGDQARGDGLVGQSAERLAHHGRARHFTERAQVRQARRTVAGLENHRLGQRRIGFHRLVGLAGVDQGLGGVLVGAVGEAHAQDAGDRGARLLEGPGAGVTGEGGEAFKHAGRINRARAEG